MSSTSAHRDRREWLESHTNHCGSAVAFCEKQTCLLTSRHLRDDVVAKKVRSVPVLHRADRLVGGRTEAGRVEEVETALPAEHREAGARLRQISGRVLEAAHA